MITPDEFKTLGEASKAALFGVLGMIVIFAVMVYAVIQLPSNERLLAIAGIIIGILLYKAGVKQMQKYNDFIRGLQDDGKIPK